MADLVVIVPSRGRPAAAHDLARAFRDTCTADTRLLVAIDADDPQRNGYFPMRAPGSLLENHQSTNMVSALNAAAGWLLHPAGISIGDTSDLARPYAIGFMGDDHRPRSTGWDAAYLAALQEMGTGIVYGDDLLQHERLPTQCAMTADIVEALGYMAPPRLRHMFVDDFWLQLGRGADCIRYLADVVVEHLHPAAGKAEADAGYERANAVFTADHLTFEALRAGGGLTEAIAMVSALRGGVPA